MKTALIILTPLLLLGIAKSHVYALTMSDTNYVLQTQPLSTSSYPGSLRSNTSYTITASQTFKGEKYSIQNGFSYSPQYTSPFSLSVSEQFIHFGPLSPTDPVVRQTVMTIAGGPPSGYVLFGFEDQALTSASPAGVIPDTSCDNGLCTSSTSDFWASILTYGFGYRCDNRIGTHCSSEFANKQMFKRFANNTRSELPALIASDLIGSKTSRVLLSYKVNVSTTQPAGSYQNTITYLVIPNY